MQVLTIPPDVTKVPTQIRGPQGLVGVVERDYSFAFFLMEALKMNELFHKGSVNARLFNKLMTILESVEADQKEIQFEDEDFKKVKDSVAQADWATSTMNRAFIPFYDAVDAVKNVPNPNAPAKK